MKRNQRRGAKMKTGKNKKRERYGEGKISKKRKKRKKSEKRNEKRKLKNNE